MAKLKLTPAQIADYLDKAIEHWTVTAAGSTSLDTRNLCLAYKDAFVNARETIVLQD